MSIIELNRDIKKNSAPNMLFLSSLVLSLLFPPNSFNSLLIRKSMQSNRQKLPILWFFQKWIHRNKTTANRNRSSNFWMQFWILLRSIKKYHNNWFSNFSPVSTTVDIARLSVKKIYYKTIAFHISNCRMKTLSKGKKRSSNRLCRNVTEQKIELKTEKRKKKTSWIKMIFRVKLVAVGKTAAV